MSAGSAFQLQGQTFLVGVSAVQVVGAGSGVTTSTVRIRCLVSAYLTVGGTSAVTAAGAPGAGSPVSNTIGMSAGGVEVLSMGVGNWFISNVAASFEVTVGEGL